MNKPKILVVSARGALRYVMDHFCEPGVTEYPKNTENYAVISIQDTIGGGFGFELRQNQFCKGAITLFFDDIEKPEAGLKLMDKTQARNIISFIEANDDVDTLLIHCFAGVSRSMAVGAFASELLGLTYTGSQTFNRYVYDLLKEVYLKGARL